VHNYYSLINVPLELESGGFCAIVEVTNPPRARAEVDIFAPIR
jgi:hypothetical protein